MNRGIDDFLVAASGVCGHGVRPVCVDDRPHTFMYSVPPSDGFENVGDNGYQPGNDDDGRQADIVRKPDFVAQYGKQRQGCGEQEAFDEAASFLFLALLFTRLIYGIRHVFGTVADGMEAGCRIAFTPVRDDGARGVAELGKNM